MAYSPAKFFPFHWLLLAVLLPFSRCRTSSQLPQILGFQRQIISGAPPRVTLHEDGSVEKISGATSGDQYFFLIISKDSTRPNIVFIDLPGGKFKPEISKIDSLPFIVKDKFGRPDTLFDNKVKTAWLMNPGEKIDPAISIVENSPDKILIGVQRKNGVQEIPATQIRRLDPLRLQ